MYYFILRLSFIGLDNHINTCNTNFPLRPLHYYLICTDREIKHSKINTHKIRTPTGLNNIMGMTNPQGLK